MPTKIQELDWAFAEVRENIYAEGAREMCALKDAQKAECLAVKAKYDALVEEARVKYLAAKEEVTNGN